MKKKKLEKAYKASIHAYADLYVKYMNLQYRLRIQIKPTLQDELIERMNKPKFPKDR